MGIIMRKRFKESEIINFLRAIEVNISEGMDKETIDDVVVRITSFL